MELLDKHWKDWLSNIIQKYGYTGQDDLQPILKRPTREFGFRINYHQALHCWPLGSPRKCLEAGRGIFTGQNTTVIR